MSGVDSSYRIAEEKFSEFGIDTTSVLKVLNDTSISIHCWQGDDVTGFENISKGNSGGGILATGNFPGKARNSEELREDLEEVLLLVPGKHRVNIHAMYGDFNGNVVAGFSLGQKNTGDQNGNHELKDPQHQSGPG